MDKLRESNIWIRTLSGAVLVAVVMGAVLLSEWTFGALLLAIGMGCLWEFYGLARAAKLDPQRGLGMALGAAVIAFSFLAARGVLAPVWLWALILPAMAVFAAELYRRRENPLGNIASTIAGICYACVPVALLAFAGLRSLPDGILYDPWMILCFIFIVWTNDIGAYLVGVTCGKHRLFERISPKKSWEGFFGGVAVATGVALLCGWLRGEPLWLWGVLGVAVSVGGVFGDLIESMLKRSVGVKDSGQILPGHGGFLDRFDALIFSSPILFLLMMARDLLCAA